MILHTEDQYPGGYATRQTEKMYTVYDLDDIVILLKQGQNSHAKQKLIPKIIMLLRIHYWSFNLNNFSK